MMVIQEERIHKRFLLAFKLLSKHSISMSLIMHIILVSIFMEYFYDYLQQASRQEEMYLSERQESTHSIFRRYIFSFDSYKYFIDAFSDLQEASRQDEMYFS